MRKYIAMSLLLCAAALSACGPKGGQNSEENSTNPWQLDQFADLRIMRYEIPEWDSLTPQQHVLCYYLSQAALCGRDILWDQNYEHNLAIRHILEGIYRGYKGDTDDAQWKAFEVYLKRVWFSNGIHHHYAETKIEPGFEASYLAHLVQETDPANFPEAYRDTVELLKFLIPILYDPSVAPKRVNKAAGVDLLATSSMNFYRGVTQAEAESYYKNLHKKGGNDRLAYGMNSQLVKNDGVTQERVWSAGGMYGAAIEQIIFWLEKAKSVAETPEQARTIETLIAFYQTGSLEKFNEYCIAWVNDTAAKVDFVNGFIEDYGDPLGIKCSWEGLVNFKDLAATRRTEIISANAQWFEDHSPIDAAFRKPQVKGITAKVINAVQLGGDSYPSTPIGINLPNANWIRREHGSKSVTLENITYAYDKAAEGNGFLEEFANSPEEIARARKYAALSSNIHTDLHECLGHGSGQLAPGIKDGALKNYSATLEEARADLFALYYIRDPKLVELGVLPEGEYSEAEYDSYIRNGLLTQVTRIKLGEEIEEDHMRNRALIARWCFENGQKQNVIELLERKGKHCVKINDYDALRNLFGQLLKIVQRIKSTGDFQAGKELVEQYGVKIDPELHKEVLTRYQALNLAPYGGFVNPRIVPVEKDGQVVDATVQYENNYVQQMLEYGEKFSLLPLEN